MNAVLPSIIETAVNHASMPKADPAKWVAPKEISDVILFLASDAANRHRRAAVGQRTGLKRGLRVNNPGLYFRHAMLRCKGPSAARGSDGAGYSRQHAAYRLLATFLILKSSIRLPDLSCATTQRGCFPRPDQVSEGLSGFRYLGKTGG